MSLLQRHKWTLTKEFLKRSGRANVSMIRKPSCLICSESIAVLKEYHAGRHHNS
jgi:hypothetical protein